MGWSSIGSLTISLLDDTCILATTLPGKTQKWWRVAWEITRNIMVKELILGRLFSPTFGKVLPLPKSHHPQSWFTYLQKFPNPELAAQMKLLSWRFTTTAGHLGALSSGKGGKAPSLCPVLFLHWGWQQPFSMGNGAWREVAPLSQCSDTDPIHGYLEKTYIKIYVLIKKKKLLLNLCG